MKIVFLGTPVFAVNALTAIHAKHEILAVITQPDKAGNRGKIVSPPVKIKADELGLAVFQFDNINIDGVEIIEKLKPDVMITAAYGQLLSDKILSVAKQGTLNIHASLLPKYRGASPINSVLINGESETGITTMRTVKKMDAGDVLLSKVFPLNNNINAGELTEKLSQLGAEAIISALELIEKGQATYTPQDESQATFCKKITAKIERIDWSKSANEIHNLIRGLSPTPCAWSMLNGKRLKIIESEVSVTAGEKAVVTECKKQGITVGCGDSSIIIKTLQYEGGKIMSAADFVNGRRISVGERLE
ncbi:MAG TPA: methionyl-tRNA formyltransferase [Eubacteriales bacterium]|nr:methionyl-tRNA formyltransferase [Eubacteriales bacterium]